MLAKIKNIVSFIQNKIGDFRPEIGIILGSGLGDLGDKITVSHSLAYVDIPDFPVSTVGGHAGRLIFGTLGSRRVVVMQGRFHYYEGYTPQQITIPVRVMGMLGIRLLVVSNAAGGMNMDFRVGDLMLITDHINFIPSPLIGPNVDDFGTRFPTMTEPYDRKLVELASKIAEDDLGFSVRRGCYVAVTGPAFETPAEVKFYRTIGGDSVGMSTTSEVLVARHMGIPVFGISIITNILHGDPDTPANHAEVLEVGRNASSKMTSLVEKLIDNV